MTLVVVGRRQTTCDEVTTRQYDAENRIIYGGQTPFLQTNCASAGQYVESYDWGPNGHPARIGSAPSQYHSAIVSDTLHWDGDQLLFTTDSQGHVDDIKIGDQADITPHSPGLGCLSIAILNARGLVRLKFETRTSSRIVVAGPLHEACLPSAAYDVSAEGKNGAARATIIVYPGIKRHETLLLDPGVHFNLKSPSPDISSFKGLTTGLAVRVPEKGCVVSLVSGGTELVILGHTHTVYRGTHTGLVDGDSTLFDFIPPGNYVLNITGANFQLRRPFVVGSKDGIQTIVVTKQDVLQRGWVTWPTY